MRVLEQVIIELKTIWNRFLISPERLQFFDKLQILAKDALLKGHYTLFDAHTSANCCHGLALLTKNLIQDLIEEPEDSDSILHLSSLFALHYAKEVCPNRGRLTRASKLVEIHPTGEIQFSTLIRRLQRLYANLIATSYVNLSNGGGSISGFPLQVWRKYLTYPYLRKSESYVYAPSMFSMQVLLYYLAKSRESIGFVVALVDNNNQFVDQYKLNLKGNGENGFDIDDNPQLTDKDPIIIFGGCADASEVNLKSYDKRIFPWATQFPSLVLACDAHYPHFPKHPPILIEEEVLNKKVAAYSSYEGFSAKDPSLFCLTHIFTASGHQFKYSKFDELFIPMSIRNSHL